MKKFSTFFGGPFMPETRNRQELWGAVKRGDSSYWTRIGTAFENKDGSWNLLFDFFPTSPQTTIQMRVPKEDAERRSK